MSPTVRTDLKSSGAISKMEPVEVLDSAYGTHGVDKIPLFLKRAKKK